MATINSTAQVETLHPRPARQPAATPPRKQKAKARASGNPLYGWHQLGLIVKEGLGKARATLGLANGLHKLFALRLAEAEEEFERQGKSTNGDDGTRYRRQHDLTQDLRTWVGVLAALEDRARKAEHRASQSAERVGYAVRRRDAA